MLARMLMRRGTKFVVIALACLMASLVAVATLGSSALAQDKCKPVNGHLDSVAVDLDGNPETLETAGRLIGGIQADFEFTNFSPSAEALHPDTPSVFSYTGSIELTLKDGTVVKGIDTGVLDFTTGELTELTTFIEKDGVPGEFGRITVSGIFDLAAQVGDSDYQGRVCFKK